MLGYQIRQFALWSKKLLKIAPCDASVDDPQFLFSSVELSCFPLGL